MNHLRTALVATAAAWFFACSNGTGNQDAGSDVADTGMTVQDVVDVAVDNTPPPPPALFGPCTQDSDCPADPQTGVAGVCLHNVDGWPGGFCSEPCQRDFQCNSTQSFVSAFCRPLPSSVGPDAGAGMRFCLRACVDGFDCGRDGYTCVKAPNSTSAGVCTPSCDTMDCGSGAQCNVWTSTCEDPSAPNPPPGSDDGGPCMRDSDCRSGQCLTQTSGGTATGWNGGYCVSLCRLPLGWTTGDLYNLSDTFPQSNCPNNAICFPNSGNTALNDPGVCLEACTQDSQCRQSEGYFCRRTFNQQHLMCPDGGPMCSTHYITLVPHTWNNGFCDHIDCVNDTGLTCPTGYTCQMQTQTLSDGSTQTIGVCVNASDAGTDGGTDAAADGAAGDAQAVDSGAADGGNG